MRCSFTTIGALLLYLRTALVSAGVLEPRYYGQPYKCDGVYISGSKIEEVVRDVKFAYQRIQEFCKAGKDCKEQILSLEFYAGPPFTKSYLLWPLSLTNDHEVTKSPYRAVLNDKFEVLSVIIKYQNDVKECEMIEKVVQRHYPSDFSCRGKTFGYRDLVAATTVACPWTKGIAKKEFPARFDGPNFINHGKKRYIYPIFENKLYQEGEDPGRYRLMMNSACKLVGVVMLDENSNYEQCDIYNFSLSQLYR